MLEINKRNFKKNLASNLEATSFKTEKKVNTSIHGICIEWNLMGDSKLHSLLEKFKIEEFSTGDDVFAVYWEEKEYPNNCWEDENPDCDQFGNENNRYALQRDFVARQDGKDIYLISCPEEEDGFHNFLRWMLPPLLVKRNKILLHSSAILGPRNNAYVCLGHSGAGKSTIASFNDKEIILGDDMNLLSLEEGKCFVEPAAVGQAIQNQDLLGKKYPVHSFFILNKAKENIKTPVNTSRGALALFAGTTNFFLGEDPSLPIEKLQELVARMSLNSSFFKLDFNLDREVWNDIFFNQ